MPSINYTYTADNEFWRRQHEIAARNAGMLTQVETREREQAEATARNAAMPETDWTVSFNPQPSFEATAAEVREWVYENTKPDGYRKLRRSERGRRANRAGKHAPHCVVMVDGVITPFAFIDHPDDYGSKLYVPTYAPADPGEGYVFVQTVGQRPVIKPYCQYYCIFSESWKDFAGSTRDVIERGWATGIAYRMPEGLIPDTSGVMTMEEACKYGTCDEDLIPLIESTRKREARLPESLWAATRVNVDPSETLDNCCGVVNETTGKLDCIPRRYLGKKCSTFAGGTVVRVLPEVIYRRLDDVSLVAGDLIEITDSQEGGPATCPRRLFARAISTEKCKAIKPHNSGFSPGAELSFEFAGDWCVRRIGFRDISESILDLEAEFEAL